MKPTLLIAEGDAELCDLYRRFFTLHGYVVEIASDGLSCLEKLRQLRPAVLVLDRDLPWGGGDGVLALLREESVTSRAAVILTATGAYTREVAEDLEPPVVTFFPKPFAPTRLLESVRAVIARKGQEEPLRRREQTLALSE